MQQFWPRNKALFTEMDRCWCDVLFSKYRLALQDDKSREHTITKKDKEEKDEKDQHVNCSGMYCDHFEQ